MSERETRSTQGTSGQPAQEPQTKTYKEMSTGRVETAVVGSDVEKALIEQGYVEIDPQTGEPKDKAAAEKAAAESGVKPLNPNAKVTTEADDEIASATVETKQPDGQTDVTSIPKPLNEPRGSVTNEPKDKPDAPAVPKRNN
jgi:hypothetical protein